MKLWLAAKLHLFPLYYWYHCTCYKYCGTSPRQASDHFAFPSCGLSQKPLLFLSSPFSSVPLHFPLLYLHVQLLCGQTLVRNFFMLFLVYWWLTPDSTCWSSSDMVLVPLVSLCKTSISVVTTMYDSLLLRRNFSVLIVFLAIFSVIVFLTLLLLISPKLMRYQRWFIEENFSVRKITFR